MPVSALLYVSCSYGRTVRSVCFLLRRVFLVGILVCVSTQAHVVTSFRTSTRYQRPGTALSNDVGWNAYIIIILVHTNLCAPPSVLHDGMQTHRQLPAQL